MELFLSRASPLLELEEYNPPTGAAKSTRDCWTLKMGEHIGPVRQALQKAQQRYKKILTSGSTVVEKT